MIMMIILLSISIAVVTVGIAALATIASEIRLVVVAVFVVETFVPFMRGLSLTVSTVTLILERAIGVGVRTLLATATSPLGRGTARAIRLIGP